jgi:NADPH-dependent 2,4-dienoyl-CoA reductase/sulfur reductase-like enzyme
MTGTDFDIAVIGAGPAGMSAAATSADAGLRTIILDEQRGPGGQIYRAIEEEGLADPGVLGPDYRHGAGIARRLHASNAAYAPETMAWLVDRTEDGFAIACSTPDGSRMLTARRLIIATGAMERPVPVPGWTLPGVMSAGAAQIMLKQSGIVAGGDDGIVLAGCGPLLFLIAAQYVRAGAKVAAILETTTLRDRIYALQHLPGALRGHAYLRKGLGLLSELRRAGVPILSGVSDIRIDGRERAETLSFRHRGARRQMVAPMIVLHEGVVPNTQLPTALGCRMIWDDGQACWRPELGRFGATSEAGIQIAGDGGGIDGARSAELSGELAAIGIARDLGALSPGEADSRAARLEASLAADRAIRPFLERLYRPHLSVPVADDAIVCRCEEVTAGEVRAIAAGGCPGPNQMKSFSRAGMGPCQGRMCGLTVTRLMADVRQESPSVVGYYRLRMPIKPVTVAEMAELSDGSANIL